MKIQDFTKEVQVLIKEVLEVETNQADARQFVDSYADLIKELVAKGEKVSIPAFGDFEKVTRSARKGRNPQTQEEIDIAAKDVPKFKPAKAFKDIVEAK